MPPAIMIGERRSSRAGDGASGGDGVEERGVASAMGGAAGGGSRQLPFSQMRSLLHSVSTVHWARACAQQMSVTIPTVVAKKARTDNGPAALATNIRAEGMTRISLATLRSSTHVPESMPSGPFERPWRALLDSRRYSDSRFDVTTSTMASGRLPSARPPTAPPGQRQPPVPCQPQSPLELANYRPTRLGAARSEGPAILAGSPRRNMNSRPHQRFNIVKLDGETQQRTLVSRLGRVWVGTEPAARVEALRLGAAEADHKRWSYEVVAEAQR
jgi:hypothetical protein